MAKLFFSCHCSRQLRGAALRASRLNAFVPCFAANNAPLYPNTWSEKYFSASTRPSKSLGRLQKTTCMVTGASSGIGFAITQRMLLEGADKVILVSRSEERLNSALERLGEIVPYRPVKKEDAAKAQKEESATTESKRWGGFASKSQVHLSVNDRVSLVIGDVGNPSFWSEDVKKVMNQVDILVNAAGVSHTSLLPFAKDEAISDMLNTNLRGTIFACRAMASRVLRKPSSRGNGDSKCIINISSLHAVKGGIGAATYASTKAGVIALTRAIVAEAAASRHSVRLRANVIVPGYIETKMLDELSPQIREEARLSVPLQRFGTSEEVADAALFLATNQYANNCVLNLDGGLSAL
uniref:3-oxoacyl-[acyl-carrier-protein] reductase n=1 Tax=Coccidioides posadasii RMSCC 3488 TaxID=454284 RepID=A0A0J6F1D1_COCPO|nr:3-oxoacyl-[acyl-carrier-protein] reductase [Coccidioides posadasii RMSCC 3488]